MFKNEYHFLTRWRVRGTPEEVYRLLDRPVELPRWWPSVYLTAREEVPADGSRKIVHLLTKGWLPYTLQWRFRTVEKQPFSRIVLEATGDFIGRGEWTFSADGDFVDIAYDWRVEATKPFLRRLSFLLRPVFSANHRWAMAKGEESLRLELRRLQAKTEEERQAVPAPPGPIRRGWLLHLGGVVLVAGCALAVWYWVG